MNDAELQEQKVHLLNCWRHTSRANSELTIGAVTGLTGKQIEYVYRELDAANCAIQALFNRFVSGQPTPPKDETKNTH